MDTGKCKNSETIHNLYITRSILYQTLHTFANIQFTDFLLFALLRLLNLEEKLNYIFLFILSFLQSIFLQIMLAKFLCFKYLIMILSYYIFL